MEKWMDLKKEIKIGDYVAYIDSGQVVCDENKEPVKVIQIKNISYLGSIPVICVFYSDGGFDYLSDLEVAPPLLLELL